LTREPMNFSGETPNACFGGLGFIEYFSNARLVEGCGKENIDRTLGADELPPYHMISHSKVCDEGVIVGRGMRCGSSAGEWLKLFPPTMELVWIIK
ncbi:hypothetical protein U1Q18_014254, partial [Sarracenia purpurea var. burkii]